MKEETKNLFLAVAVGMTVGIGLLVGISAIVNNAMMPVKASLDILAAENARTQNMIARALPNAGERSDERTAKKGAVVNRPQAKAANQQPPEDTTVYDIPVGKTPVLGKEDAVVTITAFYDLQCPYCGRFDAPVRDVLRRYPADVKLLVKHYPLEFHEQARPAAKAVLAAGAQGKYYEMVELCMTNRQDLNADKFKEFAQQLGLDVVKFEKDLQEMDGEWEARIQDDMILAGKLTVRGTPTFFLNGRKTRARSLEEWNTEIDALLKELKK